MKRRSIAYQLVAGCRLADLGLRKATRRVLAENRIWRVANLRYLTADQLAGCDESDRLWLARLRMVLADLKADQGAAAGARPRSGGWTVPPKIAGDLGASVEELGLSTRMSKALSKAKIRQIGDLLEFPKRELSQFDNVGRISLAELERELFEYLSGRGGPPGPIAAAGSSASCGSPAGIKAFVSWLLSELKPAYTGVIAARYGLWDGGRQTLAQIGAQRGVTRERIRQMEKTTLDRLRRRNAVTQKYLQEAMVRARLPLAEQTCGVLNEADVAAALADDCTAREAAGAIRLLAEISAPGQDFLRGHFCEAEPGIYCTDSQTAHQYRRLLEAIKGVLREHRGAMDKSQLCDEAGKSRLRLAVPRKEATLQRIVAVSPSLVRLDNGTIRLRSVHRGKATAASSAAAAGS